MKRYNIAILPCYLLMFMLFTAYNSIGQGVENHHHNDSLETNVPSRKDADLNILTPPTCFEPSTAFNGYVCLANSSAIMMHMIENVSYLNADKGMTEDFYKANGFTFVSSFDLKSDHGVKGKVYKTTFKINGSDFIRYIVLAGGLDKTIWLNITYPLLVEELMEIEILKSLQTLNLKPGTDEK